jgi:hypothetical protein
MRRRCDGGQPCRNCNRSGRTCVYGINKRKLKGAERTAKHSASPPSPTLYQQESPPLLSVGVEDMNMIMQQLSTTQFADAINWDNPSLNKAPENEFVSTWIPRQHGLASHFVVDGFLRELEQSAVENTLMETYLQKLTPLASLETSSVLFGGISSHFYEPFKPTKSTFAAVTDEMLVRRRHLEFLTVVRPFLQQRLATIALFFSKLKYLGTNSTLPIPANSLRPTLLIMLLCQVCIQTYPESQEAFDIYPYLVALSNDFGAPDLDNTKDKPNVLWVTDWQKDDDTAARNLCISMTISSVSICFLSHSRPIWPVSKSQYVNDVLGQKFMLHLHNDDYFSNSVKDEGDRFIFKGMLNRDFKAYLKLWFLTGQVMDFKLNMEHEAFHPKNVHSPEGLLYRQANERIADIYRSQLWGLFQTFEPSIRVAAALVDKICGTTDELGALEMLQGTLNGDEVLKKRFVIPDLSLLMVWHVCFVMLEYKVTYLPKHGEGASEQVFSPNFSDGEPFTIDLDSFFQHALGMIGICKCLLVMLRDNVETPTMPLRFFMSREVLKYFIYVSGVLAANHLLMLLANFQGSATVRWKEDEVRDSKEPFALSSGRIPVVECTTNLLSKLESVKKASENAAAMLRVLDLGATWGCLRMRAARDSIAQMIDAAEFRPLAHVASSWKNLSLK